MNASRVEYQPPQDLLFPDAPDSLNASHKAEDGLGIIASLDKKPRLQIDFYRTRAIITRGLYTFYPIFEDQNHFLRSFFAKF